MKDTRFADILDVARVAGVSAATVSRCFNHPNKVKPDTRKRILRAVEETGYIRNRAAQAIHGKRSGTIGLIVPTLDNAIFANLMQAFSEQLRAEGFTMLVATHGYNLELEYQLLRSLLEHRVEGIGLIGLDHRDETYALLERRETPVVALWNYAADARVSCIGADNHRAGQLVAQHMLELGHRDIAVAFPKTEGNDRAEARLMGVLETLRASGVEVRPSWNLRTLYSIKQARSTAEELFKANQQPTAVIAANDVIAQGVSVAASAAGLSLPSDLSVTGIGDFTGSADLNPRLTTVRLRPNSVGTEAARILELQINRKDDVPMARILVPAELKVRESTAHLPVSLQRH